MRRRAYPTVSYSFSTVFSPVNAGRIGRTRPYLSQSCWLGTFIVNLRFENADMRHNIVISEFFPEKSYTLFKYVPRCVVVSNYDFPAGTLSNFAPRPFGIDGVKCNSIRDFLNKGKLPVATTQSLFD